MASVCLKHIHKNYPVFFTYAQKVSSILRLVIQVLNGELQDAVAGLLCPYQQKSFSLFDNRDLGNECESNQKFEP